MSRVDITPDELEAFITFLKNFNEDVENRFNEMEHHLSRLGSNWRDQEYTRFYQTYQETLMKQIWAFLPISTEFVPILEYKLRALRDYLERRIR